MDTALKAITGVLAAILFCAAVFAGGIGQLAGIGTTYAAWTAQTSAHIGDLRSGDLQLQATEVYWQQFYTEDRLSIIEGHARLTPTFTGTALVADLVTAWDGYVLSENVDAAMVQVAVTLDGAALPPSVTAVSGVPLEVSITIEIGSQVPAGAWVELGELSFNLQQHGGGWESPAKLFSGLQFTISESDPGPVEPPVVGECPAWVPKIDGGHYLAGDCVTHEIEGRGTRTFLAAWTASGGEVPGLSNVGAWMEFGDEVTAPDGTIVRTWTDSWIYRPGNIVEHDGLFFEVRDHWSPNSVRGQCPGDPHGPWQQLEFE